MGKISKLICLLLLMLFLTSPATTFAASLDTEWGPWIPAPGAPQIYYRLQCFSKLPDDVYGWAMQLRSDKPKKLLTSGLLNVTDGRVNDYWRPFNALPGDKAMISSIALYAGPGEQVDVGFKEVKERWVR